MEYIKFLLVLFDIFFFNCKGVEIFGFIIFIWWKGKGSLLLLFNFSGMLFLFSVEVVFEIVF